MSAVAYKNIDNRELQKNTRLSVGLFIFIFIFFSNIAVNMTERFQISRAIKAAIRCLHILLNQVLLVIRMEQASPHSKQRMLVNFPKTIKESVKHTGSFNFTPIILKIAA